MSKIGHWSGKTMKYITNKNTDFAKKILFKKAYYFLF